MSTGHLDYVYYAQCSTEYFLVVFFFAICKILVIYTLLFVYFASIISQDTVCLWLFMLFFLPYFKDDQVASWAWWTWVWESSGSWWWTGKPGVLQSMGSQRVRHDWATEQKTQIVVCIFWRRTRTLPHHGTVASWPPLLCFCVPSLSSLISNCLNLSFVTQGGSKWLNETSFLQTRNEGRRKDLNRQRVGRSPIGSC